MRYKILIRKKQVEIFPYFPRENGTKANIYKWDFIEGVDRVDEAFEMGDDGFGRFYLHSTINNDDIELCIIFNEERSGSKEILSGKLETECNKLIGGDHSNLDWWFNLERGLLSKSFKQIHHI